MYQIQSSRYYRCSDGHIVLADRHGSPPGTCTHDVVIAFRRTGFCNHSLAPDQYTKAGNPHECINGFLMKAVTEPCGSTHFDPLH